MEDTAGYLRRAFVRWEVLRPLYCLVVCGGIRGVLRYAGFPWVRLDKDTLIAGIIRDFCFAHPVPHYQH